MGVDVERPFEIADRVRGTEIAVLRKSDQLQIHLGAHAPLYL
jgi:hypothetical protein